CDTLHVCLIDSTTLSVADCFDGILQTDGTVSCTFTAAISGNAYYIRLIHRNALQTWSAHPVTIGHITSYNFSTSDTMAYGNNMIQAEPGVWSLFSGDISDGITTGSQDGFIESSDYGEIENAASLFLFGYEPSDVTGDGLVESSDYGILENNSSLFVISVHP
ncbi:MAG: hypothetical protein IT242_03285, partial [Bacteroidia bacterium]|nr:hypothetical protein [Bacteroidia bacterium]